MRFEKTEQGWKAYRRVGRSYVYFGLFNTQSKARAALAIFTCDFSKD